MKYYQVDVRLTNGFKYSYTCNARMMPGMKRSSENSWTESIKSTEITEEEHIEFNHVEFEKVVLEPVKATKPRVKKLESDKTEKPTKLDSAKTTRKPKLASLEDFFVADVTKEPSKPRRKKT